MGRKRKSEDMKRGIKSIAIPNAYIRQIEGDAKNENITFNKKMKQIIEYYYKNAKNDL